MSVIAKRVERIRKLYAEEQANPKQAVQAGDLPETYESITKEWLEATVLKVHPTQGAVLESFELGPRDDGTAERRRINMTWNDVGKKAGLPASVFCKATQSVINRINMAYGGVEFEVQFYSKLRDKVDYEAPRALFAKVDPQSYNSLVMLYDLAGKVTFLNKDTYATRDMVEDQMRTLGRLHGRFYKSTDPDFLALKVWGEGFEEYIEMCDIETACRDGWKASKSVITPEYYKREEEIWPATVASYKRNIKLPHSLVHSDVHLGNWFQTNDGRMGLQDYQCLGRGTWARDVAYCLGTACTVKDRRAWEKDLVRLYLAEFASAGGPKLDEDLAWKEIKGQSLTALAYWTLTITPTPTMPQMQSIETCLVFIERLAAQMEDWKALEALQELGMDLSMYK